MYLPKKKIDEAVKLATANKGVTYYVVKYNGRYHVHSEFVITCVSFSHRDLIIHSKYMIKK